MSVDEKEFRQTKVPAIPEPGAGDKRILDVLRTIKEAVEVNLGRRGDPLDRSVTLRELQAAGLAASGGGAVRAGAILTGGGAQVPIDVDGTINGLPDNSPPDYGQGDLTPPPRPTNIFVQSIAPNKLMVVFDPPNYGNHAYAEIFYIPASVGSTYAQFISASGNFNLNKPCTGSAAGTNPNPHFKVRATGSNVTLELTHAETGSPSDLGAAANPQPIYFFVRFVSLAKVPGPIGPPDIGAIGRPSIDPLLVLDIMTADVQASPLYSHLRGFIGSDAAGLVALRQNGGVIGTYTATVKHGTTLDSLWSVRMEQPFDPANPDIGMVAAGFGLGITSDSATGKASSIFAVNADKFAVMGSGTPYFKISGYNGQLGGDATLCVVTLPSEAAANKFRTPDQKLVTFSSKEGDGVLDGLEGTVQGVTTTAPWQVVIKKTVPATQPPGQPVVSATWPTSIEARPYFLTGATNIPFIIDTLNSVVGIRGKLVVDGLVRATQGDFNTLTASTAFIDSLRAGIVNANILVGQSIIAGDGLPNGSQITDIDNLDAWIVRLQRVTPGIESYPLRIYNPKRSALGIAGSEIFALTAGDPLSVVPEWQVPHLRQHGNLEIGGSAVFNPRLGGALGIGNKASDGTAYTLWCGADTDYNTSSANMEANGALWVRAKRVNEPGTGRFRAGFNADLFLGENALALPVLAAYREGGSTVVQTSGGPRAASLVTSVSTAGTIRVRGLRTGGVQPTLVMVNGILLSYGNESGGGDNKQFTLTVSMTGTGGTFMVQEIPMDDYFPETWDYNLFGVVLVPEGDYTVTITVLNIDNRPMSIIQGWNAMAMGLAANGALV